MGWRILRLRRAEKLHGRGGVPPRLCVRDPPPRPLRASFARLDPARGREELRQPLVSPAIAQTFGEPVEKWPLAFENFRVSSGKIEPLRAIDLGKRLHLSPF